MNRSQQAENYKKYLNNLNSDSKPFMDYNLPKGNTKIKIINSNVYILDTLNKHTKNANEVQTVQAGNKEEIKSKINTVQNENIADYLPENKQENMSGQDPSKDPIQTTLNYVNEVVDEVVEQITDQINETKTIETEAKPIVIKETIVPRHTKKRSNIECLLLFDALQNNNNNYGLSDEQWNKIRGDFLNALENENIDSRGCGFNLNNFMENLLQKIYDMIEMLLNLNKSSLD